MRYSAAIVLCLALAVYGRPMRRASFTKQNGEDAIALNKIFAGLTTSSSCTTGENGCVNNEFAQCVGGKVVTSACATGEICAALPLINSAGTSITCTTQADVDARIAATGARSGSPQRSQAAPPTPVVNAAAKGTGVKTTSTSESSSIPTGSSGNIQSFLKLDPSVIAKGFAQDGQATQEAGQVASLTSSNNFINFCASTNQPITNGQQIKGGSCNPAPMGSIPSSANMPSSKFSNPKNLDTLEANTPFTITMNIQGMETGNFVNAQTNYFSAPQQINAQGLIVGHSHVVIEAITSLQQTTPTDPTKFAFFLGLNAAAQNGVLTAAVAKGLPAGVYRLGSINSAANHQPALVPIAQHGMLDDAIYFTVTAGGKAASGGSKNSSTVPAEASKSTSASKKGGHRR